MAATNIKHMRNHRRIHMSIISMPFEKGSEAGAMMATQAVPTRHTAGLS